MSEFNAATFTASDLLTSVYRACRLPDSGSLDYSPTVVLSMATEAIHDWGGHLISTARDGRLVTTILRSLADDRVNIDGSEYALPPMALADTIEGVTWVDDATGQETGLQVIPPNMERVLAQGTELGVPTCYALKEGVVRLYPRPEARGSIKISYMRRHGQLVVGSDTSSVVSVSDLVAGVSSRVEVAAVPSSFVVGAWFDIMGRYYPYRTLASFQIGAVSGNYLHLLTTPLATLTALDCVGDTAVIYGKTPYVQLPLEMKPGLISQIATPILTELGDIELAGANDRLADKGAARARDMLSPRAKSDKQKLINPYSLARSRGRGRRFWTGRES